MNVTVLHTGTGRRSDRHPLPRRAAPRRPLDHANTTPGSGGAPRTGRGSSPGIA
jgi:hypothetical protein